MKYLFYFAIFFSLNVLSSDENRQYSKLEAASYAEVTIDHPAKEIWPHILNLGGWVKNRSYETLSGEPNQEGELIKASALGDDGKVLEGEYYYLKTIKVIPLKYYLFKAFSAEDYSVEFDGFDSFTLVEEGNTTRVIFNANLEYKVSKMSEQELENLAKKMTHSAEKRWAGHLQRLNELVIGKD